MGISSNKVLILLGVYNGELYIKDQLDSFLAQDHTNWEVYIRDDSSSDNSVKILQSYASRDPRITLIEDDGQNLGVIENFGRLMEKASASSHQYFAFSDQDDIWRSDKLSTQLALMGKIEAVSPNQPVLVHSDLEVVSAELDTLSLSFMQYQGIANNSFDPLKVLLVQNFVTGCTIFMNHRLLEIALPIPKNVLMHDWWIALCAASFGRIEFVDLPLVRYRQHASNQVGAKSVLRVFNVFETNWYDLWLSGKKNLARSIGQAQSLLMRLFERDSQNSYIPLVGVYSSLLTLPPFLRVAALRRQGICPQFLYRQVLTLFRFLLL